MEVKLKLTNEEHKELVAYCNLNDLLISSVVKDSFTTGFNIERYGLLNTGGQVQEKIVEKEVIKYVEVPVVQEKEVVKIEYVEVEKPVEVIKEIPVEKIVIQEVVKEVPVEKIVEIEKIIYDNSKTDEEMKLFSTKVTEMENIFQNEKNELLLKIQQLEDRKPEIVEVIKEVVVEKETNDEGLRPKIEALQNTVQKLKQDNIDKDRKIKEYEKTIQEIKMVQDRQAVYLKGSNLDNKL
jgi:hypothetical protein